MALSGRPPADRSLEVSFEELKLAVGADEFSALEHIAPDQSWLRLHELDIADAASADRPIRLRMLQQ